MMIEQEKTSKQIIFENLNKLENQFQELEIPEVPDIGTANIGELPQDYFNELDPKVPNLDKEEV